MSTPPTIPTIDDAATPGPPAVRGDQVVVSVAPEACTEGSGEWSFKPCATGADGEIVYLHTTTVAVEPPPVPQTFQALPETGFSSIVLMLAVVVTSLGVALTRIGARHA